MLHLSIVSHFAAWGNPMVALLKLHRRSKGENPALQVLPATAFAQIRP